MPPERADLLPSLPEDVRACTRAGGRPRPLALRELRASPRQLEARGELVREANDRHADLLERVAVPQRDRVVGERLAVDRDSPRRPDLVLAAVAAADRAAPVVLGADALPERVVDGASLLGHPLPRDEWQHRDLHGREPWMEAEHRSPPALDLIRVVRVDEKCEQGAIDARGRLDHVGHIRLARLARRLVEVFELLAGVIRVLSEVEVAAVGDSLELLPPDREPVLDVAGRRRVVRELTRLVRPGARVIGPDAELLVPLAPALDPPLVPLLRLGRRDEELHLHLLELAGAEDEVAGDDLVAERLADLRDSERRLDARELEHVLEVDEDPLRRLGAQV